MVAAAPRLSFAGVTRDPVPPNLFIALAEESGAIIPMTRWLMLKAASLMAQLLRGDATPHIAINLAPAHVANLDIVEDARTILRDRGVE